MPPELRSFVLLFLLLMPVVGCAVRNGPPPETTAVDALDAVEAPATAPLKPVETVEIIEEHWPDGSIRIHSEMIGDAGGEPVYHGRYARWHENGKPEYEVIFDHGRKVGRAVRWHMNGEIWIEEFYVDGLKDGACRTWNEAGELVKEERFAQGKPHGTWTVWKKGRVKARSCFEHGVPVECDPLTPE